MRPIGSTEYPNCTVPVTFNLAFEKYFAKTFFNGILTQVQNPLKPQ